MSLQDYYNEFKRGYWADPDPQKCECRGGGYALSDVDTWHQCPYHYRAGQPHPDDPVCPECGNGANQAQCPLCNPPLPPAPEEKPEPVPPPAAPDEEIPF